MKCCKKFVAIAVLVALGIGTVSLVKHGWGGVIKDHVTNAFKSHVPPEVQLERVKGQINKLDQDIDSNWTPIATREREIKSLKAELDGKKDKLTSSKAELQAAADSLKAKVQRVSYNGKDYNPTEARRLVKRDLTAYEALTHEVSSKDKLLVAWQKELDALMAQQDEMKKLKGELTARVAQIEADLQVLRLAETKSKLPAGDLSRLNDIKVTLAELEKSNEIKMRALELRETHNRGENVSGTSVKETDDDLINKIKAITGEKDADDVGGK